MDPRTAARAAREAERTVRLLDSRTRTIGQDLETLGSQVHEKDVAAAAAAATAAADAALSSTQAQMAIAVEAAAAAARKVETAQTVGFWAGQAAEAKQRQWEVRTAVKRDTLPRSLAPPYLTGELGHSSSAQTFDGELLEDPRIPAAARVALNAGLDAQLVEKATAAAAAVDARAAADTLVLVQAAVAVAHHNEQDRVRRADQALVVTENKALAGTVRELAASAASASAAAGVAAVAAGHASRFLREDTALAESAVSPGRRVRPDHFKGLSATQRGAFVAEQGHQVSEKATAAAAAAAAEAAAAALLATQTATAHAVAAAADAEAAARRKTHQADLLAMAAAKAARDEADRAARRALQTPIGSGGILDGFGRSLL